MMNYIRVLFISIFLSNFAFAYIDSDFDGVSDKYDECPNTPFSDLVDKKGCSIKKVPISKIIGKTTLIIGTSYATYHAKQGNKTRTLSQSIELDYEIRKIKFMIYVSRFSAKNSKWSEYDDTSFADTRLSLQYELEQKLPNLGLYLGAGIAIPNYKGSLHNNGFDFYYSLTTNYTIDKISLYFNYTFTNIGDSDVGLLSYQNTNAFSMGIGYSFTDRLYSSFSYYISDPIVKSEQMIRNISWYNFYTINREIYSTFSISHDLDSSKVSNNYGIQIGYRL